MCERVATEQSTPVPYHAMCTIRRTLTSGGVDGGTAVLSDFSDTGGEVTIRSRSGGDWFVSLEGDDFLASRYGGERLASGYETGRCLVS